MSVVLSSMWTDIHARNQLRPYATINLMDSEHANSNQLFLCA